MITDGAWHGLVSDIGCKPMPHRPSPAAPISPDPARWSALGVGVLRDAAAGLALRLCRTLGVSTPMAADRRLAIVRTLPDD